MGYPSYLFVVKSIYHNHASRSIHKIGRSQLCGLQNNNNLIYFYSVFFLYSEGDLPVKFLNIRLKEDFELKPQSKAIPSNVNF